MYVAHLEEDCCVENMSKRFKELYYLIHLFRRYEKRADFFNIFFHYPVL
jgi:hypothetical protein